MIVNVDENTLAVAEALREFVPEVIVTHPCAPRDNLVLIDQVVAAFGHVGTVSQRACVLRTGSSPAQREAERDGSQR